MSRAVRLGAFILGALILLGAGVFLIGDRLFLFSRTYCLRAPFDTVSGLDEGAVVRAGGMRVGAVDAIRMPRQPGDKVTVVMRLGEDTRAVIMKDSVASIETEGLLGDKYVSLSFGSKQGEPVADGDTIEGRPTPDMADIAKKATDMMDTTQSTVAEAKEGVTAMKEDMEALKHNFFFRGFFNKRGYMSEGDLTRYDIAALPHGRPLKTFTYAPADLFEKADTARLKNQEALDEAGKFLESTPFSLAVVTAHANSKGDKEKNLTLTQARAMVVREYLAQFKLDDGRLKTKGLGEDASGGTDASARVEILVYPPDGGAPTSGK
jgi:outer membrane protein OmpA-like peptidoglycan-associated protein